MTFLTMQQELAARLRLDLNVSDQATLAKRWLNMGYRDLWNAYDWPWAREREIVQTVIDKTAGTVDVGVSGTTVTGTSTAFASDDVGKFIQFSSSDNWYKITAVASTVSLTLEAAYVGTSALDDGTYTIRKVFYALSSSVERILDMRQAETPALMVPIHFRDFDLLRPDPTSTGKGRAYAVWGIDSSGNILFQIFPHADAAYNLEVRYKKKLTELSSDSDEPLIPTKWHHLLVEAGLARGLEYVRTDHTDRRAELKKAEVRGLLQEMIEEAEPDQADYHPIIQSRETRTSPIAMPRLPEQYDANQ